jgi:NAD(P)-dependent dehydrogenase (short-subunit alcohol dehydrogenase family)
MSEIDGRVALITGASRGLGAAVARALDERGARLALASRSGDDLGIGGAVAAPCDVREPAQVEALVGEAVDRFGGLDIVVANAGVGG